jgi:hypothetical protein
MSDSEVIFSESGSDSGSGDDYTEGSSDSGLRVPIRKNMRRIAALESSSSSSTESSDDEASSDEQDTEEVLKDVIFPDTHSRLDLDAWSVTIEPAELLQFFGPFTPVQLASYSKTPPRDVPMYGNWVLVATVNSRLMISPEKKDDLVEAIQRQGHVILHNSYPTTLIMGNAQISMGNLVAAMEDAEIDAVRVTGYGMKHLLEGESEEDMGQTEHRLAHTNRFDFGTTWPTDNIVLFRPSSTFKPVICKPVDHFDLALDQSFFNFLFSF